MQTNIYTAHGLLSVLLFLAGGCDFSTRSIGTGTGITHGRTVSPLRIYRQYDKTGVICEEIRDYEVITTHTVFTNGVAASRITLSRMKGTLDGGEALFDAKGHPREHRIFFSGAWMKREEFTNQGKKRRTLRGATPELEDRYRDEQPYDGIFFTEFPEKKEIHLEIYDAGRLLEKRIIRYGFTPNICKDDR